MIFLHVFLVDGGVSSPAQERDDFVLESNSNQERRDGQLLTTLALLQTFHAHTAFQVSVLGMFLPKGLGSEAGERYTKDILLIKFVSCHIDVTPRFKFTHSYWHHSSAKGAMPRTATRSQRPAPSQSLPSQQVQQDGGQKPGKSRRIRRKMKGRRG